MEGQNKQVLRRGKFIPARRFKSGAVIGITLFLLLLGTCFLHISASSTHLHAAKASGMSIISRSDGIQSMTATPATVPAVSVYFSKAGSGIFGMTFPVRRTGLVLNHVSSISAVANFALQQLIAGPTPAELQAGYKSLIHQSLYGRSTCVGQSNFMLALDKKGARPAPGSATITLCRLVYSAGIGMDAGIRAEIGATLKQFASIKNVVILLHNGHCFGDESGVDLCLR